MASELNTIENSDPKKRYQLNYCGRILKGEYSDQLKQRVAGYIKCYHANEETGSPAIQYIAAWREEKKEIWYEYAGKRLMALLGCRYDELAEVMRNRIIDRRIYKYPDIDSGIIKEVKSHEELSGARQELREQGKKTGEIEAVYKISVKNSEAIWLKDQATIEIHEKDRICLSLGFLTIVSKEMKAEDELKEHRDHLEEIVTERTADLVKLNAQLNQEVAERKLAEEKLRQSYNRLQQNLDKIVHVMSLTVEERDPYTAGHQRRTTDLAVAIAKEMGLSRHQIRGIRMAGFIHDIGKISIPAEILSKPGKLNEAEILLIRRHPKVGYEILKKIDFPWPVDLIVLQHHEKMDGSGYPQGLSGKETLMEAKILCVADVVETISSHRPYRPGLGLDKALEDITKNSGVLFDPHVVDACLTLFQNKNFQFE